MATGRLFDHATGKPTPMAETNFSHRSLERINRVTNRKGPARRTDGTYAQTAFSYILTKRMPNNHRVRQRQ